MIEIPQPMKDPGDVVELTRRLVRIPSYVNTQDENGILLPENQKVDEINVGSYIYEFLTSHTDLKVIKQPVVDGRFNIIATNSENPKLFLLGHIDTVPPTEGSPYDPFAAEIHENKIYGLGASDMKAGLAGVMSALATLSNLPDLYAAFYIDEEYDFAGMKKLLEELPKGIKPELLFSADGGNMSVGNGCRGFTKARGTMRGHTAHAARPHHGVDAITGTTEAMHHLKEHLKPFGNEFLGNSTVTISRLNGGKSSRNQKDEEVIIDGGNKVADIAQFALDIRTTSPEVNSDLIMRTLVSFCEQKGLSIENLEFPHEQGAWTTDLKDIKGIISAVEKATGEPVKINDATEFGYVDLQMAWEALNRPPAAMFGPEITRTAHTSDEHVNVDDIIKARDIFIEVTNGIKR